MRATPLPRAGRCAAALFVLCCALAPSPSSAQTAEPADTAAADSVAPREPVGGAFFGIGGAALDLDGLNAALAARGLPELRDVGLTTGGGAYLEAGRWLLMGSGQGYRGERRETDERTVALSGGFGLVDVGYSVVDTRTWRVTPLAGAGAGYARVRIRERGDVPFDGVLDDPRLEAEVTASSWLWHAGLSVERSVKVERGGHRRSVGLQAGWMGPIGETDWSREDDEVTGGPETAFAGPYVRLTFVQSLSGRRGALFPALGALMPSLARR